MGKINLAARGPTGSSPEARSGCGYRPMKDEWALELRDRCSESGAAFHFKQHSAFRSGTDPFLQGVKYHESPLVQIATRKGEL